MVHEFVTVGGAGTTYGQYNGFLGQIAEFVTSHDSRIAVALDTNPDSSIARQIFLTFKNNPYPLKLVAALNSVTMFIRGIVDSASLSATTLDSGPVTYGAGGNATFIVTDHLSALIYALESATYTIFMFVDNGDPAGPLVSISGASLYDCNSVQPVSCLKPEYEYLRQGTFIGIKNRLLQNSRMLQYQAQESSFYGCSSSLIPGGKYIQDGKTYVSTCGMLIPAQ